MGDFRPQLFFAEVSLFLVVQLLGLWVGVHILKYLPEAPQKMDTGFSVMWFLAAFLVATILIILLIKFIKKPFVFTGLFYLLVFIGSETVFEVLLTFLEEKGIVLPSLAVNILPSISLYAIILSFLIIVLRVWKPNVISHNVAIVLAVSGIGATLGLILPVIAIVILLLVLSVYDFIAVFKTKHMVKMFSSLMKKGTPLAIIIPEKLGYMGSTISHAVKTKISKVPDKRKFVMLGTGDLVFPIILAVSVFGEFSLLHSLFVVVGSLVGILIVHLLLTQKKIQALPALPPITFGALLFLGIAWLLIDYLKILI